MCFSASDNLLAVHFLREVLRRTASWVSAVLRDGSRGLRNDVPLWMFGGIIEEWPAVIIVWLAARFVG